MATIGPIPDTRSYVIISVFTLTLHRAICSPHTHTRQGPGPWCRQLVHETDLVIRQKYYILSVSEIVKVRLSTMYGKKIILTRPVIIQTSRKNFIVLTLVVTVRDSWVAVGGLCFFNSQCLNQTLNHYSDLD